MTGKKELYEALLNKDKAYLGLYYAAVKSTGVYCVLNCRCKKPLFENVEFYDSIEKCVSMGFRSCRVCNPLSSVLNLNKINGDAYNYLQWLEHEIFPDKSYRRHNLKNKATLTEAKKIFKEIFIISLGKYIRIKRIIQIMNNSNINVFKILPNKLILNYISTPLGEMISCHTDKGLHLLEFIDRLSLENELYMLSSELKGYFVFKENSFSIEVANQLKQYFNGERKQFSIKLSAIGTSFQKEVWNKLLEIEYGKTISYSQQAKLMGRPNHTRSVSTANGKNMISIIIPCHRVISIDGNLGGYGGGIKRKKYLLNLEMVN